MNPVAQIPADNFLDQVISALTDADLTTLRRLETAVLEITAPENPTRYLAKRDTLADLLDASARNLRFLRRVTRKQDHPSYLSGSR